MTVDGAEARLAAKDGWSMDGRKDKVSTTGICVMGVFWTETKERELGQHHVYVRENHKYLDGFAKPL